MSSISVMVRSPNTKTVRTFSSVSAVARMLSGNGTASGGLRESITLAALAGSLGYTGRSTVRNNAVILPVSFNR